MTTDVNRLFAQYTANHKISRDEVSALKKSVGEPEQQQVEPAELRQMQKARTQFKDEFSPAALKDFDRYVGTMRVQGGKVTAYYQPFRKQWKIDSDARYRQRWGCAGANDAKAPTFERTCKYQAVTADLRATFEAFAQRKVGELQAKPHNGAWNQLDPSKPPKRLEAVRIYDRDRRHVGYILTAHYEQYKSIASFYDRNLRPIGWETDDKPYD